MEDQLRKLRASLRCSFCPPPPLAQTHHHAQEGQHFRLLLPLCHPAVQGGFRYHGRQQGRLLSADDLVAAFANHGKNISGGEAQGMLDEADGPMNFTQMVTLFASKMAGGTDDDETILKSFEAFEI